MAPTMDVHDYAALLTELGDVEAFRYVRELHGFDYAEHLAAEWYRYIRNCG